MSLQNPLVVYVERSTKPTRDSGIGHAVVPWTQYHSTCNRNTRPPQHYLRCCLLHHMRPVKGANPPRKPPGQGTHRSRPSIIVSTKLKSREGRSVGRSKARQESLAFNRNRRSTIDRGERGRERGHKNMIAIAAAAIGSTLMPMADDENKER